METNAPTTTQPVTPPARPFLVLPSSPTSTSLIYQAHPGPEINDDILKQCADLFSNNYGIWGSMPPGMKGPKPRARVKFSPARLRQQLLSSPENTVLVVCYQLESGGGLALVGHAFATSWDYDGGRAGWITQLVVSVAVRKRYIATSLLQMLKVHSPFRDITAIGLVSSHPAACHALAKYASVPIQSIDLGFCRQNARAILEGSPVGYVREMQLRGSLFEDKCAPGTISCVFTSFYIDHAEPLEALAAYQARGQWLLGELLDGHEFLIILPFQKATSHPRR